MKSTSKPSPHAHDPATVTSLAETSASEVRREQQAAAEVRRKYADAADAAERAAAEVARLPAGRKDATSGIREAMRACSARMAELRNEALTCLDRGEDPLSAWLHYRAEGAKLRGEAAAIGSVYARLIGVDRDPPIPVMPNLNKEPFEVFLVELCGSRESSLHQERFQRTTDELGPAHEVARQVYAEDKRLRLAEWADDPVT